MVRPTREVADIFRDHGPAWRDAQRGHVNLGQLKVMSAIEDCRTAILGGHVARCENATCGFTQIAYNSCRNRHCPKCQWAQARDWMEARQADLLPVPYFHVVFTLPEEIGSIAYHNKAVVYDLLFRASSETVLRIAADPKHLGAQIGMTAVLHTWGSALTHHPHVHMIVPGGGISLDGARWIATNPNFFLPVFVLSRLFRRLMLEKLLAAHATGKLVFFGANAHLAGAADFAKFLTPLRTKRWFVYAKEPFAGPEQVLAYLSRYTHRVAISNSRLLKTDGKTITFRVKNYRANGRAGHTTMTLDIGEFIRRFLLHVLPKGFHRIRHYGLLATGKVPRRSNAPASCLVPRSRRTTPRTKQASRLRAAPIYRRARAAVVACASSRPSCVARDRAIARRRARLCSGSTRHEDLHVCSPKRWYDTRVLDRRRNGVADGRCER